MNKQKGFIYVLVAVIVLLLLGGSIYYYMTNDASVSGAKDRLKDNSGESSTESESLAVYTSQNIGISFEYPVSWSVYEQGDTIIINDDESIELDDNRSAPNYSVSFALVSKDAVDHFSGYGHVVYDPETDLIQKDGFCLNITNSKNEDPTWINLGGSSMSSPAWTSSVVLLNNSNAVKYTRWIYGEFIKDKDEIVSNILSSVKIVGDVNVAYKDCPEIESLSDEVADTIRKPFTVGDITFKLVESGEKHQRNSDLYFVRDGIEKLIYKNIKYGPNGGYFFTELQDSNSVKLNGSGGDICLGFNTDLYIDLDNPEEVVFVKYGNECSPVDNLAFGLNGKSYFDIKLIEDNECSESNSGDKLNITGIGAFTQNVLQSEFKFSEPIEVTCTGLDADAGYRNKSVTYGNIGVEGDKINWVLRVHDFVDAAAEPYSRVMSIEASLTSGFDI